MMHKQLVLALALLAGGPLAVADDFYISAGIGVSMIDDIVDTSPGSFFVVGELPGEISLNGRAFDSSETASQFAVGWNVRDWLSLEVGFADFGNVGEMAPASFIGPIPIVTPVLPIGATPPDFASLGSVTAVPAPNAAALTVKQWSFGAKFRKPLTSSLSATWSVGVTRAQFDAEGSLTFNQVVTLDPLVFSRVTRPYASPEDETGFNFGAGFEWRFSDRLAGDIGYRRHDTGVIDVETVLLELILTL